jgi:hypothetical protein
MADIAPAYFPGGQNQAMKCQNWVWQGRATGDRVTMVGGLGPAPRSGLAGLRRGIEFQRQHFEPRLMTAALNLNIEL